LPRSRRSLLRLIAGLVLFLAAIGTAVAGFSRLFAALDAHGHGSTAVRHALIWMGAAGGGLGAGISLLIWEFSVRLSEEREGSEGREGGRRRELQ
jgi:hypothetical protein